MPVHARSAALGIGVLLGGCAPPEPSDAVCEGGDGATESYGGYAFLAECPADAPVMGTAGGRRVQEFPLRWSWPAACEESVAEPVYLRVPDDIGAWHVTVDLGETSTSLELSLDGQPLLTAAERGEHPFRHLLAPGASVAVPNAPHNPALPGCLGVFPTADDVLLFGQAGRLVVTSRRGSRSGRLPVVGVLTGVSPLTDADVDEIVSLASLPYERSAGISLDLIDVVASDYDYGDSVNLASEPAQIRITFDEPLSEPAIPLFFVDEFLAAGLLGQAGGIPGGLAQGTASTGVLVRAGNNPDEVDAFVVAHELGHQLGLFHTTEATGTLFDPLSDTPECDVATHDENFDGFVEYWECNEGAGARNVMFWDAGRSRFDELSFSPQQADVLRASPALLP